MRAVEWATSISMVVWIALLAPAGLILILGKTALRDVYNMMYHQNWDNFPVAVSVFSIIVLIFVAPLLWDLAGWLFWILLKNSWRKGVIFDG